MSLILVEESAAEPKREQVRRFSAGNDQGQAWVPELTRLFVASSLHSGWGNEKAPGIEGGCGREEKAPILEGALSSEHGTYKTVKARLWPWLSNKRPPTVLRCLLFAHT